MRALAFACLLLPGCYLAHERGEPGGACAGLSRPTHTLGPPADHRASASACPAARASIASSPACSVASDPSCAMAACTLDSDCTRGTNGRCGSLHHGPASVRLYCSYDECGADGDCASGPCECRPGADSPVANRCLPASQCHVDSDCGPGGFCSPSLVDRDLCSCPTEDLCEDAGPGTGCFVSADGGPWMATSCICGNTCAPPGYYCHTPCDECVNDGDCTDGTHCLFDRREQRWACRTMLCAPSL